MTSPSSQPTCDTCHKPQSQLPNPLKKCAKCKKQRYCSRECQKADWKTHKHSCGNSTSDSAPGTTTSSSSNTTAGGPCSIPQPFTAIDNGTWLHNRPEKDVFKLLVDIYRMRIEDQYKFQGHVDEGSLYAGASPAQASKHFRRFLDNVTNIDSKRDRKLLPEWWSQSKLSECVQFSLEDEDSNIGHAVEKQDITDHYKNPLMAMQLRIFGEKLDGTVTVGVSGAEMLAMQVSWESGANTHQVLFHVSHA